MTADDLRVLARQAAENADVTTPAGYRLGLARFREEANAASVAERGLDIACCDGCDQGCSAIWEQVVAEMAAESA